MKVYCLNWNGILDGVIDRLKKAGRYTENFHEADVFVMWQDIRGECLELAHIIKEQLRKPLLVVQHGRGATRDYGPPNKFPLVADKVLVWGETERARLLRYGIDDSRIKVVGCPLFGRLRPKAKGRRGRNVLYVPVIAGKEEPENVLVYAHLKKWECEGLIDTIHENMPKMKRGWAYEENILKRVKTDKGHEDRLWKKIFHHNLPRNITYAKGLLNVKLTPVHDAHQYHAPVIITGQNAHNHIEQTIEVLRNTDVMVCLEEGTMQLLACALDIPVIVADVFKYGNYGGVENYDTVEKIRTPSCHYVKDLKKLGKMVDHCLANPTELRKHRIAACESEAGPQLGNADDNILAAIDEFAGVAA